MTDGSDEQVTALAREVERLRRLVVTLSGQVGELGDGLAATIADSGKGRQPPVAPSWLGTKDAATAAGLLRELCRWLESTYLRYPGGALSSCWMWHPAAVEELLWLRGAHAVAYDPKRGSVTAAGDWHDRQRPGVVKRLRGAIGDCELSRHGASGDRRTVAPDAGLVEVLDDIARHWTENRTTPEPDEDLLTRASDLDHRVHTSSS